MTNIQDLYIEQQILPLFDFTRNDFSREILLAILKEPLSSAEEVLSRQAILRGLLTNHEQLKDYSYSRVDMIEVYRFHQGFVENGAAKKTSKLRLLLSEKERHQTRSRHIQFVLFFYKLQTHYVQRINLDSFSHTYRNELRGISDFINIFNPAKYERLIRSQHFKISNMVELSDLLAQKVSTGEITLFWKRFFLFEAYLSISMAIGKYNFSFPSFSESGIRFENLYHPLLSNPVKNSFTTTNNVFLLTGPNMSGKSTFLKAVGLSVYLAHVGVAVPASKVELPFFDSISISINLSDDLLNGYSHFMTEVLNLKKVVVEAAKHKKCFAVFDELFRGTNMEDAIEITTTTINGLTNFKNSFFFISTHLQQIKEAEKVKNKNVDTYYIDCVLNNHIPTFSYQLRTGWSDVKVGSMLFEKEGLNELLNTSQLPGS